MTNIPNADAPINMYKTGTPNWYAQFDSSSSNPDGQCCRLSHHNDSLMHAFSSGHLKSNKSKLLF